MGRFGMSDKGKRQDDAFDLLLAEFIAIGQRAKNMRGSGDIIGSDELRALQLEARSIVMDLARYSRKLEPSDDRKLLFAVAVAIASGSNDALLDVNVMELLTAFIGHDMVAPDAAVCPQAYFRKSKK